MATQSQGIRELMSAEKQAAQVVAHARKSKEIPKMARCIVNIAWLIVVFTPRIN